ncbi:hypothetical protein JQC91_03395 [Jannaschia sp. Os4]|uniref:hypothetical protein n=1 Tax=Jannaschia sp. Os4 TaxID=2807617 RepID=UPI0019399EEA|nr:hypothetical protein [Jannaschia sp. Os4]MBM2575340.1 hypothetical protein [Jannaschia sp. Os4]
MRLATLSALALAVLAGLSFLPARGGAVVVGDGSQGPAYWLELDGPPPTEDPRVTGVTLRRWANLRHFPEIDCGRHCDGRAEMVVILAPRPWGWRKTVLIEVDEPALDEGGDLPEATAHCIGTLVRLEWALLRGEDRCGLRRVVRWDLPLGL